MELIHIQQSYGEELILSPSRIEEIMVLSNVQNTRHSRYLTPEKARKLWEKHMVTQGISPDELDPEFWYQIRSTTFPLSSLTDEEESELQEFLLHFLETITQAGVLLLTVWLVTKLLKRSGETYIEIGKADEVAIQDSTIDKSRTKVEQLAPSYDWKVSPQDASMIEVTLKVPEGSMSKAVFVALVSPKEARALCFAKSTDYLGGVDVPTELVSMLRDGSEAERSRAAHFLAAYYGECSEVRKALVGALSDPAPSVRATVIDALGELKATEGAAELIKALDDSNSTIQNLAAIALARIGDPRAFEPLVKAFKQMVWEDATLYLVMRNCYHPIVWAIIRDYQNQRLQKWYDRLLVMFPKLSAEVIIEALTTGDETEQLNALLAMEEVLDYGSVCIEKKQADQAADVLRSLIAHTSFEVRYHAIRALGRLKSPGAIVPLSEALQHVDVNTRAFAAYYLEHYRQDPDALQSLASAYLKERDKDLRKKIGHLLGKERPQTWLDIVRKRAIVIVLVALVLYWPVACLIDALLTTSQIVNTVPINYFMFPFYVLMLLGMLWAFYEGIKKALPHNPDEDLYWPLK